MARVKIPLNQLQTFGTSGGQLNFDFSRVQSLAKQGGKHLHVREIIVKVNTAFTQLANSDAIYGYDLPALLNVSLERHADDPSTRIMQAMPGDILWIYECLANNGITPRALPSNIAAVGGGGPTTNTSKYYEVHIRFDNPWSLGTDDGSWPLSAFDKGRLTVDVQNVTTVLGDAEISYQSGATHNVDVDLICVPKSDPRPGVDLRYGLTSSQPSQNDDITGLELPAGKYESLIYCPRKLANTGGDNASKIDSITSVNHPQIFPTTMDGEDYNEMAYRSGLAIARLDTSSPIGAGKCVILRHVPMMEKAFNEMFSAPSPFLVDVTCNAALTNYHRFAYRRVFAPSKQEDARIAATAGIRGPFSALVETADGQTVATKRAALLPRKLVPGVQADNKVRRG